MSKNTNPAVALMIIPAAIAALLAGPPKGNHIPLHNVSGRIEREADSVILERRLNTQLRTVKYADAVKTLGLEKTLPEQYDSWPVYVGVHDMNYLRNGSDQHPVEDQEWARPGFNESKYVYMTVDEGRAKSIAYR